MRKWLVLLIAAVPLVAWAASTVDTVGGGGGASSVSELSGLGTGIATALAVNAGSAGAPSILIASGATTVDPTSINSGACNSANTTATATGVASTDVVAWTPNADISAVTGYAPVTTGGVVIFVWPTTNTVNFRVCNPTSSSIDPGSITINWRVER